MMLALFQLLTPTTRDLIGLIPELTLSGAFIVALLLDATLPARWRSWIVGWTLFAVVATLAVSVWGWFDASPPRLVYFGAIAYDRFSLFVNMIILASTACVVVVSPAYLSRKNIESGEYYALILAAAIGMMFLGAAASLLVVFLGIELLSIALYILSGFLRGNERSQEAGVKYLLLGGFASGFLLYGMALIYGETGHTQLDQIAQSLGDGMFDPLLLLGIGLLLVGFAFKVSAAPFHMWTPDVYQGAPLPVTTFMSVTTKVAAFAAFIRVFTYALAADYDRWRGIVFVVAILSMIIGNIAALTQTSIKRMLAYSGIAQAGYIMIGVAVHSPQGTVSALFYLAAYAMANICAFAVVTLISGGEDIDHYENLKGLAFRRPYAAVALAISLLSLGGFPFTAGFFAKFLVFSAAVQAHQVPLALWGVATSAVAVFYYLKVALLMTTQPAEQEITYSWPAIRLGGGTVIAITTVATVAFGIAVAMLYAVAVAAQHSVLPSLPGFSA